MEKKTFAFIGTFKEANMALLIHWKDWVKLASGPWIILALSLALTYLVSTTVDAPEVTDDAAMSSDISWSIMISAILSGLLAFVSSIMFNIRVVRFWLLEEIPASFVSLEWNIRHWKLIGYSILLILALGIPIFLAISFVNEWLGLILGIAAFYFAIRLSLFPISIGIDDGNPYKASWSVTRGWIWLKLLGFFFVVALPAAIVLHVIAWLIGILTLDVVQALFTLFIVNFAMTAISITGASSCYRQLR